MQHSVLTPHVLHNAHGLCLTKVIVIQTSSAAPAATSLACFDSLLGSGSFHSFRDDAIDYFNISEAGHCQE